MTQAAPSNGAESAVPVPQGESADQPPPAASARSKRAARPVLLAITTIAVASAAGVTWWQRSHMPVNAGTLEPVPATTSILIPGEDVGAVSPEEATAPSAPASAPQAPDSKQDGLSPLRVNLEQLASRVSSLEEADRTHAEQIADLRAALDKATARHADRDKSAEQARPLQAGASPSRAMRSASSTSPAPKPPTASVLAVDLWGGQPSVVVGKDGAGGTELRFISQGETQGRVTLKSADAANQRATFATPTGEFTMSVGDR